MENGRSHILSPQFCMLRGNCPALGCGYCRRRMSVTIHRETRAFYDYCLCVTPLKPEWGELSVQLFFLFLGGSVHGGWVPVEVLHKYFPVFAIGDTMVCHCFGAIVLYVSQMPCPQGGRYLCKFRVFCAFWPWCFRSRKLHPFEKSPPNVNTCSISVQHVYCKRLFFFNHNDVSTLCCCFSAETSPDSVLSMVLT